MFMGIELMVPTSASPPAGLNESMQQDDVYCLLALYLPPL